MSHMVFKCNGQKKIFLNVLFHMVVSRLCDFGGEINKIDCGSHALVSHYSLMRSLVRALLGKEDSKEWPGI